MTMSQDRKDCFGTKEKEKNLPIQSSPGSRRLICSLEQKLPALLKTKEYFLTKSWDLNTYSKTPESLLPCLIPVISLSFALANFKILKNENGEGISAFVAFLLSLAVPHTTSAVGTGCHSILTTQYREHSHPPWGTSDPNYTGNHISAFSVADWQMSNGL